MPEEKVSRKADINKIPVTSANTASEYYPSPTGPIRRLDGADEPPAANAPRQPCAGGGGYGSCRDARDTELCANCEPAAPPVPQEAAPRECDCEECASRLATAPDSAMRQDEPLKALRQWEADTEAPANASEGNAFIDGFNAGREAGSERERELLRRIMAELEERGFMCCQDEHAEDCPMAEASRLLGRESK